MDIKIIFENKDFLVIDKPANLLTHSASKAIFNFHPSISLGVKFSIFKKNAKEDTLVDWLVKNYPVIKNVGESPERPGIVHRLDKDTSGLMIIAKNNEAFFYFKKLFQEHKIHKKYLALVYGVPKEKEGIINKPLGYKSGTVKRTTKGKMKDIKSARTFYRVLKIFDKPMTGSSLLEVSPQTGRTHQIRVHLASIGYPVVGDQLYGRRKNIPEEFRDLKRQFLHAYFLEFPSPDGKGIMRFESDLPRELENILQAIAPF